MESSNSKVHRIIHALNGLLVGLDESEPEQFPGHHKAYLNTVAIPRAQEALLEAKELEEELSQIDKLAELMRTQDNYITSHPMYLVQERVRDYGFDVKYGCETVWIDEESHELDADEQLVLEAKWLADENDETIPDNFDRVGYRDRWEFVTACFTEEACIHYIKRNGHNLKFPRIYVNSAHRNYEWQKVRKFLMKNFGIEHRAWIYRIENAAYHLGTSSDGASVFRNGKQWDVNILIDNNVTMVGSKDTADEALYFAEEKFARMKELV